MKHDDEPEITGVARDVRLRPDGIGLTLSVDGEPQHVFVPIQVAELLISILRRAADDVHLLRQEHGTPPGEVVVSEDPKPVVNLMAMHRPDGQTILQFRHPDASTTAVLLASQGLGDVGSELVEMARELAAQQRGPRN